MKESPAFSLGSSTPGQVDLQCIRKGAEQAGEKKLVSSDPQWSLLNPCPGCPDDGAMHSNLQ